MGEGGNILLNGGHDSGGIGAHGAAQVDTDADENQDAPVDALVDHSPDVQQGPAVNVDHRHYHHG